MTTLRDEDVGGLDIPMDDLLSVGCVQAIRNLNPQVKHLVSAKRVARTVAVPWS